MSLDLKRRCPNGDSFEELLDDGRLLESRLKQFKKIIEEEEARLRPLREHVESLSSQERNIDTRKKIWLDHFDPSGQERRKL